MLSSTASSLRPIKIAYLVEYIDKNALNRVIETNSYLWGGMYNWIIPVHKRIPTSYKRDYYSLNNIDLVNNHLLAYDPDFIVNLSSFDDRLLKSKVHDWQIIKIEDILGNPILSHIPSMGIGLHEILSHIEENEFKYVRKFEVPIYDIQIPDRYSLFYKSVFGSLTEELNDSINERYAESLSIKKVNVTRDDYMRLLGESQWFNRRLGQYTLRTGYRDDDSLYVFYMDANDWQDIVDYWNMRASGIQVLAAISQGVKSDANEKYIIDYLENGIIESPKGYKVRPAILKGRSISESDFEIYFKYIHSKLSDNNKKEILMQNWIPRYWQHEPGRNQSQIPSVYSISKRQSFNSSDAAVQLVKPKMMRQRAQTQYKYVNEITYNVYGADKYYAEVLANTEQFASHILGTTSYNHWRISNQALVYIASSWDSDDDMRISIPDAESIYSSWYKKVSKQGIVLSTPGKIASQMLKKLGGPDRTRLLANEGLLKLIQKTVTDGSSTPTLGYTKLIAELNKIANSNPMWDAKGILRWLLKIGALQLGTEIQCPNCSKRNWYQLNQLDDRLRCEKCLDDYDVATESPNNELKWTYSLTGPFRLPNMADGAYTTLLALWFMTDQMHFSLTPHLSFTTTSSNGEVLEADFGALIRGRSFNGGSVVPAFGEAKSFYHNFEQIDIDRLKRFTKDFDDSVLIFATLKNKLHADEKKRLQKLLTEQRRESSKKNGRRTKLLVLTGNELLSVHIGFNKEWESLSPKHKSLVRQVSNGSLSELCDAMQQLYLDSQPESEWFHELLKKDREKAQAKSPQTISDIS